MFKIRNLKKFTKVTKLLLAQKHIKEQKVTNVTYVTKLLVNASIVT